jgi:hypothetical protein
MPEYAGSRYQLDRVRGELSEFQRQWDESAYEPSQADHVIRALGRALSSADLLTRDRDLLSDDDRRQDESRKYDAALRRTVGIPFERWRCAGNSTSAEIAFLGAAARDMYVYKPGFQLGCGWA